MPHCIIEYSYEIETQVSVDGLVQAVLDGAKDSKLFDETHIKVRALAYRHYHSAASSTFIHVTVRLHAGRSVNLKQHLTEQVMQHLSQLRISNTVITIETVDIERESYLKRTLK